MCMFEFNDGTSVITVDLFFTCRKKIWYNVKRFFSRLLNPDISLGARDYYVPMLFFDILCFLTIVFGVASFGVSYTYVHGCFKMVAALWITITFSGFSCIMDPA